MNSKDEIILGLKAIDDEAYSRWVHQQYTQDKLISLIGKYVENAIELLKGQEQQESEWVKMMGMMIPELHGYHECKNCGYHEDYHNREVLYPFCPNCGAKMKNGVNRNDYRY